MDAHVRQKTWELERQLAAEREQLSAVTVALTKADTQLAAEREEGVKALTERSFELHECQKQLAAERLRTGMLVDALKESREYIWDSGYFDNKSPLIRVIDDALAKV